MSEITEPVRAPDYARPFLTTPSLHGPVRMLRDGRCLGHNPMNSTLLLDVKSGTSETFLLQLPVPEEGEPSPPVVHVISATDPGEDPIVIYDARRHTYHPYFEDPNPVRMLPRHKCATCQGEVFRISMGFEIPPEQEDANDFSWICIAALCIQCRGSDIVFEDEMS